MDESSSSHPTSDNDNGGTCGVKEGRILVVQDSRSEIFPPLTLDQIPSLKFFEVLFLQKEDILTWIRTQRSIQGISFALGTGAFVPRSVSSAPGLVDAGF